jgi:hypothetical protein
MSVAAMPIDPGDAGTEQTIAQMRRLIDAGSKDPTVHEFAARAVRCLPAFAWMREAEAIFNAVRRAVRFTRDIRGKETLHAANETLRLGIGDCDDFTILICAALSTIGARCRIVTVAAEPPETDGEPAQFSHVFPEVWIPGGPYQDGGHWVAVDAARRWPKFGARPRYFSRARIWDTQSDDFTEISGLNGLAAGGGGSPMATLTRQRVRARMRGLGVFNTVPGGLPGAWRPNSPEQFRNLLPSSRLGVYGLRGQGHYGRVALDRVRRDTPGMAGLGQDDLTTVLQALPAITTGTANIITATRANPLNLVPYTGAAPTSGGLTPAATAAIYGEQLAANPLASISPTMLLFGVGALVLVMSMGKNR